MLAKADASRCPEQLVQTELERFEQEDAPNLELEAKKQRKVIQRLAQKTSNEMIELGNQIDISRSKNTRLIDEIKSNFQTYLHINRISEKDKQKFQVLQELAKRKATQLDTISKLKSTLAQLDSIERSIE